MNLGTKLIQRQLTTSVPYVLRADIMKINKIDKFL